VYRKFPIYPVINNRFVTNGLRVLKSLTLNKLKYITAGVCECGDYIMPLRLGELPTLTPIPKPPVRFDITPHFTSISNSL